VVSPGLHVSKGGMDLLGTNQAPVRRCGGILLICAAGRRFPDWIGDSSASASPQKARSPMSDHRDDDSAGAGPLSAWLRWLIRLDTNDKLSWPMN
jgi:hypothetical protein